jgi:hypothetical protein
MGRAANRKRALSREQRVASRTHGSGPKQRVVLLLTAFKAAGEVLAAHTLGQPLGDVRLGAAGPYDRVDDLQAVDVSIPKQRAAVESRMIVLATGVVVGQHAAERLSAGAYRDQLCQSGLQQMQRLAALLGVHSQDDGQRLFDAVTESAQEIITTRWEQINAVAMGLCASPTGRLTRAEVASLMG